MTAAHGTLVLDDPRSGALPAVVEPWRLERSLMLHLVEVERAAVLATGGVPVIVRG